MEKLVVSLFAGAGGLSFGFAAAGLKPRLAIELDRHAAMTYRRNVLSDCLELDLVAERTASELKQAISGAEVFAVLGGPPCQGFSTAGTRSASDPRNQLIFSYLSIIQLLKPRWFVFENVEGLLTSSDGHSVVELVRLFMTLGYTISLQKINCAGYGLPQTRKRVIIVGNDLGTRFSLPAYTHSVHRGKHRVRAGDRVVPSIHEALAGLGSPSDNRDIPVMYETSPENDYDVRMRRGNGMSTSLHYTRTIAPADVVRINHLAPGQSMRNIPSELWPETFRSRAFRRVTDGVPAERRGGAPHGLKRLEGDGPSLTITSLSTRELVHPDGGRPLTLRECARLQSFPDHYEFLGPEQSIAKQIGNAVPPHIAEFVAKEILRHDREARTLDIVTPTLNFSLSDSTGRSPALAATEALLSSLKGEAQPSAPSDRKLSLFPFQKAKQMPRLNSAQSQRITKARHAKPIHLTDREIARLLAVLLHDLGRDELIPSFVEIPADYRDYYHLPLAWFVQDQQRPFDLPRFYLELERNVEDFETLFLCITQVHKRRRKFEYVISAQSRPTMDQVARKGLLEYGIFPSPGLTAWLVWRKWIFDVDARSAQETGYLFDTILGSAVGGISYSSKTSPIPRADRDGARQVDCVIDDGERKAAYEFKTRLTIASSGQGRWREEIAFPAEAAAAGYTPILLVLDPTDNAKLRELSDAFAAVSGETYVGENVWAHLEQHAAPTMQAFLERYVRVPIEAVITDEAPDLPDATLSWRADGISLLIGDQRYDISRSTATDDIEEPEVAIVAEESEAGD